MGNVISKIKNKLIWSLGGIAAGGVGVGVLALIATKGELTTAVVGAASLGMVVGGIMGFLFAPEPKEGENDDPIGDALKGAGDAIKGAVSAAGDAIKSAAEGAGAIAQEVLTGYKADEVQGGIDISGVTSGIGISYGTGGGSGPITPGGPMIAERPTVIDYLTGAAQKPTTGHTDGGAPPPSTTSVKPSTKPTVTQNKPISSAIASVGDFFGGLFK